ncbi:hypothetical protein GCM10009122_16750 [Fulvivirga kasyanovii]|uniref:Uncharacterized protein n=1 Tax=Fulvivirga kasyanovii TaxID=396812 RepID=A0ABW9RT21_9BACT|nr:hypothetical protein [Fulvivirga kasyanovii]MTI26847.1 hypothetical protein [Fulvivirga kasyanovii]
MIPLNDFQILPFDKKCDYITIFADYMIYRVEDEKKFYLYHVDSYFIEVCYAPYENKVLGIKAFTETADLEAYLDFISISELSF